MFFVHGHSTPFVPKGTWHHKWTQVRSDKLLLLKQIVVDWAITKPAKPREARAFAIWHIRSCNNVASIRAAAHLPGLRAVQVINWLLALLASQEKPHHLEAQSETYQEAFEAGLSRHHPASAPSRQGAASRLRCQNSKSTESTHNESKLCLNSSWGAHSSTGNFHNGPSSIT